MDRAVLSFPSSARLTPAGLELEARAPAGATVRFVVPAASFAALGAPTPRPRHLLATYARWRSCVQVAATMLFLSAGGTVGAEPIEVTGAALLDAFSAEIDRQG